MDRIDKMSDPIDDVFKKAENWLDKQADDAQTEMYSRRDMERDFLADKPNEQMANERFQKFRENADKKRSIEVIIEAFRNRESGYSATCAKRYASSSSPDHLQLSTRGKSYFSFIQSYTPKTNRITNTFLWFGKDPKANANEIMALFEKLKGSNRGGLSFISGDTDSKDFMALLTSGGFNAKIKWLKDSNLLIYFMDQLTKENLVLPDSVENSNDIRKTREWLDPRIASCFVAKNGKDIEPRNIAFIRSKTNLEKLKHKEVIDEILSVG